MPPLHPPTTDRNRRVFNRDSAGQKIATGSRRRRFKCIGCKRTHSVETIARHGISQINKVAPDGLAQLRVHFSELVAALAPPPLLKRTRDLTPTGATPPAKRSQMAVVDSTRAPPPFPGFTSSTVPPSSCDLASSDEYLPSVYCS
jgi:hypothetical protein